MHALLIAWQACRGGRASEGQFEGEGEGERPGLDGVLSRRGASESVTMSFFFLSSWLLSQGTERRRRMSGCSTLSNSSRGVQGGMCGLPGRAPQRYLVHAAQSCAARGIGLRARYGETVLETSALLGRM